MKLTLKIKPSALFKLRELIENDMEDAVSRLARFEEIGEDNLSDWDRDVRKALQKDLTSLEELHGAYLTALDSMVTWLE